MGKTIGLLLEELEKRCLEKEARGKDTSVEEVELYHLYQAIRIHEMCSFMKKYLRKKHV
jgi:hypothetical protein